MSSKVSSKRNLQRLAKSGQLKLEPAAATEIAALLASAARSLADADRLTESVSALERLVREMIGRERPDLLAPGGSNA